MKILKGKLTQSVILICLLILSTLSVFGQNNAFYNFKTYTLEGEDFDFSQLKGKKVMIVNTASKCGFTPQYADLESLFKKYGGEHFIIIGFPANNFMNQEPGTNDEIKEFCTRNYGVTFPMMQKISVKGDDIDPIYQWLTTAELNGAMDSKVKWNFQKYLIDENGNLVDVVYSKDKPDSEKIIQWIEGK